MTLDQAIKMLETEEAKARRINSINSLGCANDIRTILDTMDRSAFHQSYTRLMTMAVRCQMSRQNNVFGTQLGNALKVVKEATL